MINTTDFKSKRYFYHIYDFFWTRNGKSCRSCKCGKNRSL